MKFEPKGVIPAVLLPFKSDKSIDEPAYRRHLQDVMDQGAISALTVNGHSQEVHALTPDEQARVLDIALEEAGDRVPIVAGIFYDGSDQAAAAAAAAERQGASALLVFPSNAMSMEGQTKPAMALAHFRTIADRSSLPIICFQYALSSGLAYPINTLVELAETVSSIVAIKDWCNDVPSHERHIRTLRSLSRPVAVLTTHSAWLLSSLVLGCDGLLSGAGSVIARLQLELFDAVQNNDLARARVVYDRMQPITASFYSSPFTDMHNRMKEALVLLGKLDDPTIRPPLTKLADAEIASIRKALVLGGMLQ